MRRGTCWKRKMRGRRREKKGEGLETEMEKEKVKDVEKTGGEGTQRGKGRVEEEDKVCFVKAPRKQRTTGIKEGD